MLSKPNTSRMTREVRAPVQNRWIPPPTGLAKVNVDAAVSKTENRGAAAAFCRDSNGTYLGSSVVIFEGISDPACLEALACREALALLEDLSLSRCMVASDCESVVLEISEGSRGRHGAIITEIRARATHFVECSFVHESRASNFEAHNLAKHMISSGVGRHLWLGTPYSITIPI